MEDAKVILRNYLRSKKMAREITGFEDAQKYAESLGKALASALGNDFTDIDEADLAMALQPLLRRAYDDSATVAMMAQLSVNQKAKLNIGTLRPEFDPDYADKMAEELAGKLVDIRFVQNLVNQRTLGAVDETVRKNSEAHAEMGLDVHIVRTYSDVGLRAGTKYSEDCHWCISRCGDWDNYREAYDAGCFERHPGCLCVIDYHVGKTHTVSRGTDWVDV